MPRTLRTRAQLNATSSAQATPETSRPRRGARTSNGSTATVERQPTTSPEETRQSIHLKVTAPPNRLREATGAAAPKTTARSSDVGARTARNKKPIVEESEEEDEDEEEEDDEEDEDEDEDAEGEEELDEEDAEGDDDDDDAEGEEDADGDIDMGDVTPVPAPKPKPLPRPIVNVRPSVKVTAADEVEAKEVAMADDGDDDEELSDLSEEDAEGEEVDDIDGEGDDDLDSDASGTPGNLSRSETPDLSKLTRRQRAHFEEQEGGLMALSNEAQKKKHLTAEEHAMRRAEMARRRKNLSEKRNEEEKMDTINRLLKKQAPKRRTRAEREAAEAAGENGEDPEIPKANPLFVRYIQNARGSELCVPEEWLDGPAVAMLKDTVKHNGDGAGKGGWSGRMVEEVA